MANTKTNVVVSAGRERVIIYFTLDYVDTASETDYVLYDSSAVATTVGDSDPLKSSIEKVYAIISSASTSRVWLEWDATTDVLAFSLPANTNISSDFSPIRALPNQGGSGITGDILFNATGLGTGDKVTIIISVLRN